MLSPQSKGKGEDAERIRGYANSPKKTVEKTVKHTVGYTSLVSFKNHFESFSILNK